MLRPNLALMSRIFRKIAFLLGCLWALSVPQTVFPEDNTLIPQPPAAQVAQYQARVAKSILELQQFREISSIDIQDTTGRRGVATLINLHPRINTWFLLTLTWENGKGHGMYHLENRFPARQAIRLEPQYPSGIVLVSEGRPSSCQLWTGSSPSNLLQLPVSQQIYVPLCSERLYLRQKTKGHKTTKEWATDFLRTYVPGGEKITTIVKETFYQDANLSKLQMLGRQKHADSIEWWGNSSCERWFAGMTNRVICGTMLVSSVLFMRYSESRRNFLSVLAHALPHLSHLIHACISISPTPTMS